MALTDRRGIPGTGDQRLRRLPGPFAVRRCVRPVGRGRTDWCAGIDVGSVRLRFPQPDRKRAVPVRPRQQRCRDRRDARRGVFDRHPRTATCRNWWRAPDHRSRCRRRPKTTRPSKRRNNQDRNRVSLERRSPRQALGQIPKSRAYSRTKIAGSRFHRRVWQSRRGADRDIAACRRRCWYNDRRPSN